MSFGDLARICLPSKVCQGEFHVIKTKQSDLLIAENNFVALTPGNHPFVLTAASSNAFWSI